ncbi:uncharacterized protein LOC100877339 isoform X2 [Megachile rotundata]|uniref:uncharacterized protein LOC100877339 isoform X2 n=1 Tax=Megachile rotundata TaxID=143995 RepID=UPI003FD0567B
MGLFFYNFGGDQLHRFTRLYLQRLQKQLPPDVAFPCNVTDNKLSNTTLELYIVCLTNSSRILGAEHHFHGSDPTPQATTVSVTIVRGVPAVLSPATKGLSRMLTSRGTAVNTLRSAKKSIRHTPGTEHFWANLYVIKSS